MIGYVTTAAIAATSGIVIGVLLDKVMLKIKADNQLSFEQALINNFGEPMVTTLFSSKEVVEWVDSKKDDLTKDTKIVVLKADDKIFSNAGINFESKGKSENYLLVALFDSNKKDFKKTLLVKYEKLDLPLKEQLNKGNGIFILEI